jgi:protein O-mannosyl-transferase
MPKHNSTISKIKASTKPSIPLSSDVAESVELPVSDSLSRFDKLQRFSTLLPVVLALLFSVNTLWLSLACDDQQQVINNAGVKDIRNLPLAFTSTVWGFVNLDTAITAQPYYRPLFNVWSMINYGIFGTRAWGWHLMNVLIHMLATWFVFVACREFTGRKQLALIIASLFAVHPIHTESVAWVSGVTDPLMTVFVLPAFYFYLRLRKTGKTNYLAAMLVTYLLALWSKETALALPLIIAYLELFHFNESDSFKERGIKAAKLLAAFAVPILIFFLMRRIALGTFFLLEELRYPLSAALLTMPLATLKYLALIVVPYGYSYQHYTDFITTATNLAFIGPLLLLILLACAIIFKGSRLVKFASLWFIAFLLPSLVAIRNFDPEYLVQERYLYLSSMGFCMLVALAIEWLVSQSFFANYKQAPLAITTALVLLLGIAQIRYSLFWYNTVSVFQRCVAVAPNSAAAHASLSNIYYPMGKPREAEAAIRRALQLDPKLNSVYLNLSYFSKQSGKLDEAIDYLEQAKTNIPLTPLTRTALATTLLNLGLLYGEKKDYEKADENLWQSLELWERANAHYNIGQYYLSQNKLEEALYYFEKTATLLPPRSALIHVTIGSIYEKLRQPDKAIAEYNRFLDYASASAAGREEVMRRLTQLQSPNRK